VTSEEVVSGLWLVNKKCLSDEVSKCLSEEKEGFGIPASGVGIRK